MYARTPSRIGEPVTPARQGTGAKTPGLANCSQMLRCCADSTLMQKLPDSRSFGQLVLFFPGHTATSGGSSDSDVNDCAAKPAGWPSRQPVAMTTPVANCDSVLRKLRASKFAGCAGMFFSLSQTIAAIYQMRFVAPQQHRAYVAAPVPEPLESLLTVIDTGNS